jgi:Zn finger protein HypA/HybF involved in hydrogenase expression
VEDSEEFGDSADYDNLDDTEEFRCESCNRRISEEEYEEHGGLCRNCRGMPTQRGFSSPSGFPKM